ncbi:MAG: hypothetical protein IME99_06170 [Proteobacteria bacterium]|nr:hypothetical protein [Pseudomonadota bacterium]
MRFGKTSLVLGALLLSASLASAGPVSLGDSALDQVTAGTDASHSSSGSGGAIIGNSSEATISQTGGVTLEGEAQSGAKGLNLVNSAESTVANGINIWEVNGAEPGVNDGQAGIEQSNIINQEQRRSASMPNYSRPEGDTLTVVDRTGSETHNDSFGRNNDIADTQTVISNSSTKTTAGVNTLIAGGLNSGDDTAPRAEVTTNPGKGGAGAGIVSLGIDGGEVHVGLAVGGPVIAAPDVVTTVTEATGETTRDSYGGMLVEGADLSLYGRLILPDLTIEINGAGCGVVMGSCEAGGETSDGTSNITDNTVMDNETVSSVGDSEFTDNSSNTYRSPFELNNAQAEYIVVDDSSLTVNTTFNLTLSGSAQSNANAMNIVNATGSAVADGVNIARTGQLSSSGALGLSQTNVISHSR